MSSKIIKKKYELPIDTETLQSQLGQMYEASRPFSVGGKKRKSKKVSKKPSKKVSKKPSKKVSKKRSKKLSHKASKKSKDIWGGKKQIRKGSKKSKGSKKLKGGATGLQKQREYIVKLGKMVEKNGQPVKGGVTILRLGKVYTEKAKKNVGVTDSEKIYSEALKLAKDDKKIQEVFDKIDKEPIIRKPKKKVVA